MRSFRPDVITACRKTTKLPWRFNASAHHQFLGTIERFVEPTHRRKSVASTEQETTGGQASCPERPDQDRHKQSRIQRHSSVEFNGGATTGRAAAQSLDGRANYRLVHDGVCVDKDEQIALCLSSAGIAGRRDLAVSDADKHSAVAMGDDRGSIRRCIIDDYQFVRFAYSPTCRMQGVERCSEQTLLVVGRDNERDHQGFTSNRGLPSRRCH